MKIWILIFSAALFAGGTCLGVALQPRIAPAPQPIDAKTPPVPASPSGHYGREFSPTRFEEHLQLTDEQKRELDAILGDTHEEMQALGRAMKSAQDRSRNRITEILTPAQKTQFDALMAEERQKRAEAELNRNVESYRKILGLSEEQAVKFRAALADGRSKRRDGYKPGNDWRQTRKDSREAQNKKIEEALDAKQYQSYLLVSELERNER